MHGRTNLSQPGCTQETWSSREYRTDYPSRRNMRLGDLQSKVPDGIVPKMHLEARIAHVRGDLMVVVDVAMIPVGSHRPPATWESAQPCHLSTRRRRATSTLLESPCHFIKLLGLFHTRSLCQPDQQPRAIVQLHSLHSLSSPYRPHPVVQA
jgi:hypothetical protein